MVHWIRPVVSRKYLLLSLCVVACGLFLVFCTQERIEYSAFQEQMVAAQLMAQAMPLLKEAKLARGLPLNRELDPNETGLIGESFTVLTTSLGNIEAKRTSTNPAFAALLVRLFTEAGLTKGDVVAVGASGSFPALIVATLAACEALELEPMLIYSVGSSMFGANLPEFTFQDMLAVLTEHELLPFEIMAASLGGDNDRGEGLIFPESQQLMWDIAAESAPIVIFEANSVASIQTRLALYLEQNQGQNPACFVNVGGATPNHGNTSASLQFPNGLVKHLALSTSDPERGLIFEFLERGVPVIHLLNIRDLALKSGITIDPVPFPPLGSEDVFYQTKWNKWLIFTSLALLCLVMAKARQVTITNK